MAKHFSYYDPAWRTETFTCPCGWAGTEEQMGGDAYADLRDCCCPLCDRMLLIIEYPLIQDLRRIAATGNKEAQRDLALWEPIVEAGKPKREAARERIH